MQQNKAKINLVVDEGQKEKWQEEASIHPNAAGNLSALIRLAVEKEISGQHDTGESSGLELAPLSDKLDRLIQHMDSLDSRIQTLESRTKEDPELDRLKNAVFSSLPTIGPQEDMQQWEKRIKFDEVSGPKAGTIQALAEFHDAPEYRINEAIRKLESETHGLIHSVELAGEKRYYKVE